MCDSLCCLCVSCIYSFSFACIFFFKQKTAYEMRISDWSSDVCSSDRVPFAGITRIMFIGLTPIASLSPFEHPNGESGDSRLPAAIQECRRRHPSRRSTRCRHARPYFFGLAAAPRLGRRTALTVPLLPPPQK